MKLYFVRHSEPDYNILIKDQGSFPGPGLTSKGLFQAKILCKKLDIINFDYIFCSDLRRTKETIQFLKSRSNLYFESDIRESADYINGYLDHNDFIESINDQKKRLNNFIKKIINIDDDKIILIVSHFNTIEYISTKLGSSIKKPEYSKIYSLML